ETAQQLQQRWESWAAYVGDAPRPPGWHAEFMTSELWKTFAPWYVAVPFFLVCGFAIVYLLGSKAYCTYGCPYGGFFGPADLVAPGKIVVNDDCNHCGHCTAVCTSNVRVHEEVRDFGKVVDPGCMKCMDCISVCPNDALYFGFAKPPALGGRRAWKLGARGGAEKKAKFRSRVYDLALWE